MYSFIYLLCVFSINRKGSQACLLGGVHFQDVPKDGRDPGFRLLQTAEGLPGVHGNKPGHVGDGFHAKNEALDGGDLCAFNRQRQAVVQG